MGADVAVAYEKGIVAVGPFGLVEAGGERRGGELGAALSGFGILTYAFDNVAHALTSKMAQQGDALIQKRDENYNYLMFIASGKSLVPEQQCDE
jgi:hypothetical protein